MRVVVLDDYQQVVESCAPWHELGDAEVVFQPRHVEYAELLRVLDGADVVVTIRERTPLPAEVLRRLPSLRLVVTAGMNNASIDVAAAREIGIEVCGTRQLDGPPAELTWGLILAVLRRIPVEDAYLRGGGWQSTVGHGLEGATLGLIGLGRVGQRVARVAAAFEMAIVGHSANLDPAFARSLGVEAVSKSELLHRSDVVSLHLRLSGRSRGVVGEAELREMKASAILVNTARGPLVDEAALLRALDERWIAGAGLDVYDREPLPSDHPLRRSPRTVLTPHIGYVTAENYRQYFCDAVDDILAWRDGEPIRVLD